MTGELNEQMLSAVTQAMAPYAIAKGKYIPDVVNTLFVEPLLKISSME